MNLYNNRYCNKMWRISACLVVVNYICASASPIDGGRSFTIYETPENIMSHGYPAERHQVTTEDGYILEMHRIPGKRGETPTSSTGRPVVFLMHGLSSASSAFIGLGPEWSIGYHLADAGLDVWMGNARGTRNSRKHITLDPDNEKDKFPFFDFSFEEIGTKDIPAMVDYALRVTGQSQLHYIGHSQGGTVFFVLTSMHPEYSVKFKSAHLLAPSGYQNHTPPGTLISLARLVDQIYALALSQGIVEWYPPNFNVSRAASNTAMVEEETLLCSDTATDTQICRMINIIDIIGGAILNDTRPPGFHEGGLAVKQAAHYGQNIRDNAFRRWNYGAQNPDIYGQADPPIYNLSLIVTNTVLHYSVSDDFLDERDALAMVADMPNATARRVARDSFLHSDYIHAEDSRELVTNYIIDAIWSMEDSPDSGSHGTTIFLSVLLKGYFVFYILRTFLR